MSPSTSSLTGSTAEPRRVFVAGILLLQARGDRRHVASGLFQADIRLRAARRRSESANGAVARSAGVKATGVQKSTSRLRKTNPAGITPMMVRVTPLMATVVPIARRVGVVAAAPQPVADHDHRRRPTRLPRLNARPSGGSTPSTVKKFDVTRRPSTCSGGPSRRQVGDGPPGRRDVGERRDSARASRSSWPGAGVFLANPMWLASSQTMTSRSGIRQRQPAEQHRVHHGVDGRVGPDTRAPGSRS